VLRQIGKGAAKQDHDMPARIAPLVELAPDLAPGPLIGLDLGTKTIGVALSDRTRTIASAVKTILRRKFTIDATELLALAAKEKVAALVLGLPLNMDGTEGPRAQATRAFARNLAPLTEIPIGFWDERLSTMAVTRTLLEADTSRAKRAEVVDKMAAAYLLQGALDRLRSL
jgi:putative Holliday junction resolvase